MYIRWNCSLGLCGWLLSDHRSPDGLRELLIASTTVLSGETYDLFVEKVRTSKLCILVDDLPLKSHRFILIYHCHFIYRLIFVVVNRNDDSNVVLSCYLNLVHHLKTRM